MATQVNLTKILTKEKRNHTNTHKQTTQSNLSGVFNARVHYTVLTQHPNHTPPTHKPCQQDKWSGTKKGNNAPDTQQCTNIQTTITFTNCARQCVTKRHSNTQSVSQGVCSTRILNNKAGSMTLAYSTNQRVQLHPKNKAP